MPDSRPNWRSEASRRLTNSKLSAAEREEISRELAGYLDDLCDDARSRGLDDSAARQCAAAELYEDKHLGANLFRARKEGNMNDRTRQLWLPGVVILLAAVTCFYFSLSLGFGHILWIRTDRWALGINIPWLCFLPLLGAVAAYWSRKQGAGRAMQIAAGLFPFVLFLAVFFGRPQAVLMNNWQVLPIRFAWPHVFGPFGVSGFFSALVWTLAMWICVPIGALLAGVLPVLRQSSARRTVDHA